MPKNKIKKSKRSDSKRLDAEDIIALIERDHKPLKKLIKSMKDEEADLSEVQEAFEEFAPLLEAHAHPEQEALYSTMKDAEGLATLGFEGETEHGIADELIEQIKDLDDENEIRAHIKVLAELVEHHIEEEEEEIIPEVRKELEEEERIQIGQEYLRLRDAYDITQGEEEAA